MTVEEVNKGLIGKRVSGIFTSMRVEGHVSEIIDNEYSKGVKIELDDPVNWGGYYYHSYTSTARKMDNWGNLKYTKLINS